MGLWVAIGDSYNSCYSLDSYYSLDSENKQDLAGFGERSSLRGVGVFRGFSWGRVRSVEGGDQMAAEIAVFGVAIFVGEGL